MRLEIGQLLPSMPVSGWKLPPLSDVRFASLTDVLADLRDFQHALCPRSRHAITALNRAIATQPRIEPSPTTKQGKLYSSIALAVDRGALVLYGHDISVGPIETLVRHTDPAAALILSVLRLYSAPPSHVSPLPADMIGWLYLLGRLDTVLRGFRPLSDIDVSTLPPHLTEDGVREWLSEIVPPDVCDEIRGLLEQVSMLQPDGTMLPNPIFGGLGPIAGSDGDWIAGDTLVELKCTLRGIKRQHVVQLLCYAALGRLPDRDPEISNFSRIALMLPRQSSIVTGTIEEWLGAFGAPPAMTTLDAILDYFTGIESA